MLQVNFQQLQGNNAPVKSAKSADKKHCQLLAGSIIEMLLKLEGLTADERQALEFIKTANSGLNFSFAQCKSADDAMNKYSHFADFGEKRFYSIDNAPSNLFDLLANLSTGYRLFKAVKIVTAQAQKPLSYADFVGAKKLPTGLAELPQVQQALIQQYYEYCNSLQLSKGTILDLFKLAGFEVPTTDSDSKQGTKGTKGTK